MNREQRLALVVALVVALWGLAQAFLPFTTASNFAGAVRSCGPPIVSLGDDEAGLPNDFFGGSELPEEFVDNCSKGAGRRLVKTVVAVALAAAGGYVAFRLLDDRERRRAEDADPIPLNEDLPPYASD